MLHHKAVARDGVSPPVPGLTTEPMERLNMADVDVAQKSFKSPPIHRTPEYRAYAAYYGMLARCGNADGKNPSYSDVELRMTLDQWLDWSVPRYAEFIRENPDISPSVSRFGDAGHYEIGNLEIISFAENRSRQKRDTTYRLRSDGTKLCSKCQEVFAQERFQRYARNPDGLNNWCRACVKIANASYRKSRRASSINGRAQDS